MARRAALPDHPLPAGLALPEVDTLAAQAHTADCVCEEGWVVPEQPWDGVAVAALLARAVVQPAARFLKVSAGDYTVLLPREDALAGGALLARSLNGQPLTPAHGAPLRLVAPGRVCWESVQWVDRLEVLADAAATTGESLARAAQSHDMKKGLDTWCTSVTASPGRASPVYAGLSRGGAPLPGAWDGGRAATAVRHARATPR